MLAASAALLAIPPTASAALAPHKTFFKENFDRAGRRVRVMTDRLTAVR
ncbi:hypothetical protein [Streptomyces longisporus]